ncbi:hypothetical protein IG521_17860 [Vibrio cholerae]|uniref:hypothetical protein n=1 Tax=Vibrio cholerae TaxID=666 RepID=UPI002272151F|nr:hypothetical protein [Vibrio cholerae]MCX9600280.1 hypothetical protein [Vibrio cholerae]
MYKEVIEKGNDFIERYTQILGDEKLMEDPKVGVTHSEFQRWVDQASSLVARVKPDLVDEWALVIASLNSKLAINKSPIEGYRKHVNDCLAFIQCNIPEPKWFHELISFVMLFKPSFVNKVTIFVVGGGISIIASPLLDKLLGAFLEEYLGIEYDIPHPGWGFGLVIIGLIYNIWMNKK